MPIAIEYWYLPPAAGGVVPALNGLTAKAAITSSFQTVCPPPLVAAPLTTAVTRLKFFRAAMMAGYGKKTEWKKLFDLSPPERLDLYTYLRRRAEATVSCMNIDPAAGIKMRRFWKAVETTEKASLSFAIGSAGAYLATHEWLKHYNCKIRRFLHVRLFMAGMLFPVSSRIPDYLCEDDQGDFHLIEAKGGIEGAKWSRLLEGLKQLIPITTVGPLLGGFPPKSSICVHSVVSASKLLSLTVVDPPGERALDDFAPEQGQLFFLKELLLISEVLDAVSWYEVLRDEADLRDPRLSAELFRGMRAGRSSAAMGIELSIPDAYLDLKPQLVLAGRFLCAVLDEFERLPNANPIGTNPKGRQLRRVKVNKLWQKDAKEVAVQLSTLQSASAVSELIQATSFSSSGQSIGELLKKIDVGREVATRESSRIEDADAPGGFELVSLHPAGLFGLVAR